MNRGFFLTGEKTSQQYPIGAPGYEEIGKVVEVGPGVSTVKEGDLVLYGKYSGTELTLDGKDYLIMRESDILAIV